jgi:beta-glucanase (GH16 family)
MLLMVGLIACTKVQTQTIEPTRQPTPTSTPWPTPEWERSGWMMIWHDEFNGKELNVKNWAFDIGGDGWGNNELQYYTDRPENARVEDGLLIIEARAEDYEQNNFTSARIKTQGLKFWKYGRFEARMKLPSGQGIWPAFWLLGTNIRQDGWPACGEIDIMENIGKEPLTLYGTAHAVGYSGENSLGGSVNAVAPLSDDFHVYAIEWDEEEIHWFLDDQEYFSISANEVPGEWAFDHYFFIILNLAVGGNWPGAPDDATVFPQQLLVDYVRVYQKVE